MRATSPERLAIQRPGRARLADTFAIWLLALAGLFLALTFGAFVVARNAFIDATRWVEHTNEVKVAIARARIALDEGDAVGAADGVRRVRDLTVDNPRQQARLARLDLDAPDVRAHFDDLTGEEDELLAVRRADAQRKSSVVWGVLGVSATLSVALALASFLLVRKSQHSLARQTALLGSILESIADSVVVIDPHRRFVVANAAFRRIFPQGVARGELAVDAADRQDARKEDGTPLELERGPLPRALRGDHVDSLVLSVAPSAPAARVWLSATSRPVRDERGQVTAAVAVLRDVTREREDRALLARQAEELRVQSLVDELTGLYNRRGFLLLAEQHARAAARSGRPFAILFSDLNGLKVINDVYGHDEGDRAIRRMAAIFKATLRDADIVARFGGDEYVALLDGANEASVAGVMARIKEELGVDAARERPQFQLSVSMGAAFHAVGDSQTIEELLALADDRMYSAKRASRAPAASGKRDP
jgi:diguanylate cyclase (GGDEF)-like protein